MNEIREPVDSEKPTITFFFLSFFLEVVGRDKKLRDSLTDQWFVLLLSFCVLIVNEISFPTRIVYRLSLSIKNDACN